MTAKEAFQIFLSSEPETTLIYVLKKIKNAAQSKNLGVGIDFKISEDVKADLEELGYDVKYISPSNNGDSNQIHTFISWGNQYNC